MKLRIIIFVCVVSALGGVVKAIYSNSNKTNTTEYSYFTYVGPTMYECHDKESYHGNYNLHNCTSLSGTKIDTIYGASSVFRLKR